MAKPYYNFEKRQREIAKKKKKEAKLLRKAGIEEGQPKDDSAMPGSSEKSVVSGDS